MNDTPTHRQNSSAQGGRVLVLEPEGELASRIRAAVTEAAPSAHVHLASNLEEAQRLVLNDRPDLFVLDIDAAPDLGQDFLYDLRTSHPNARAIILTGVHLAAHRESAAGLGAIHFLEKPFPHGDFVVLAQALLSAPGPGQPDSEKFQGTLSDLHLADIIQLKCMSGSSAALQFTGPQGEKARVYFDSGQVRHAIAPGKEGIAAFNEIVNWKGGQISEVSGAPPSPRTIDLDWQILLMEAVRKLDEKRDAAAAAPPLPIDTSGGQKVLVIDDSLMLLSFVKEILAEANYHVVTAATAEEGLAAASKDVPDLVLLDYVLPDMKGDEVSRRMSQDPATADIRIIYMSGFGADLKPDQVNNANVIGSLNKPFTSDLLLKTVEKYMPATAMRAAPQPTIRESSRAAKRGAAPPEPKTPSLEPASQDSLSGYAIQPEPTPEPVSNEQSATQTTPEIAESESNGLAASVGAADEAWWSAPSEPIPTEPQPALPAGFELSPLSQTAEFRTEQPLTSATGIFFVGDTSFFSLNNALQTIGREKLTGILRAFWTNEDTIELIARDGEIVLVTSHNPQLYCPEAPITLVNIDADQIEKARATQAENGCPIFLALAQAELIMREPALQLVQHYGQKLFAQLWTTRKIRFLFEQTSDLPDYSRDVPVEPDIDHWVLSTLRCIQSHELLDSPETEVDRIPAYTRDGYERVQELRLTVAEAQFASQFNGLRSIAQIAKNLRLDVKFARLTLFRFLALEIVECWPPAAAVKQEKTGFLQSLGKSIGLGD